MSTENSLGLSGFSFIEFATPEREQLEVQFSLLGFKKIAQHKSKQITLHKQGNILFIINTEKVSLAERFAFEHGVSVCGMGFQVENARKALETTVMNGATPFTITVNPGEIHLPAIYGVGGSAIYFTDDLTTAKYFLAQFDFTEDFNQPILGAGLIDIDHLKHYLRHGQSTIWKKYYQSVFQFETSSIAENTKFLPANACIMRTANGKITIPLFEANDENPQVDAFMTMFRGEGIPCISLATQDIYHTMGVLRKAGIHFKSAPEQYYASLAAGLPMDAEHLQKIKAHGLFVNHNQATNPEDLLLHIETENMLGAISFELVQHSKF
ncbi:MAG: hypothetical protein CMF49_05360 [Legionellales bacterium]|nr:hypothetical protein [Legionellales bacterium]|tara:strand:+ start:140 stop:1114 length:975 start_codon:yes stop_codon:yes gene_type:complete